MAGYATHVSQQRCLTFKSELFNEAINYICYIFGIQSMYEDQEQAIRAFFNGHDIFFSASTGYGKSLVFQSLPFVADYLQEQCSGLSSLLVVSPLHALMEEQVQKMNAIGIPSVALHDKEVGLEEKLNNMKDGVYSLIYTSPECMLEGRYWRQILSSEAFREHCIGVAVDEAHCIAQW